MSQLRTRSIVGATAVVVSVLFSSVAWAQIEVKRTKSAHVLVSGRYILTIELPGVREDLKRNSSPAWIRVEGAVLQINTIGMAKNFIQLKGVAAKDHVKFGGTDVEHMQDLVTLHFVGSATTHEVAAKGSMSVIVDGNIVMNGKWTLRKVEKETEWNQLFRAGGGQ